MSNNRNIDPSRFARVFQALSNTHRLRIFVRLAACCAGDETCYFDESNSACVGEIARGLDLAPSTVSHHIKELHQAGLIKMERQGQSVRCWVERLVLHDLQGFFGELAQTTSGTMATMNSQITPPKGKE